MSCELAAGGQWCGGRLAETIAARCSRSEVCFAYSNESHQIGVVLGYPKNNARVRDL
jgi:hypothetical protein